MPDREVSVFLDGWQIECCADPPGPGDHVRWPLIWLDDADGPGGMQVDWRSDLLPVSARNEPDDLLLRHGVLTAYWRGPAPARTRGRLVADVHGGVPEQVPPVAGSVVSVGLVDQAYRRSAPRTYVPVSGDFRLRPVPRSPKWFSSDRWDEDHLPDLVRSDSGVLVRLSMEPALLGT